MDKKVDMLREIRDLIASVNTQSNADIIHYHGPILDGEDLRFCKMTKRKKSRKNVFFILTTNGGDPDAAFRIARCLQREYEDGKFTIAVDTACKSAGTLIALGADEVVMSDGAEFGPLDVQLSKPDELAEMSSGLTPFHALSTLKNQSFAAFEYFFLSLRYKSGMQITTRTAADIAAKLVTGLFGPVFEQFDPMRLGEIQRAMLIAEHYGTLLAKKNLKDDCVDRLIGEYPSHGAVIDRAQAATLFKEVRPPTSTESSLFEILTKQEVEENSPVRMGFLSTDPFDKMIAAQTQETTNGRQNKPIPRSTRRNGRPPAEADGEKPSRRRTRRQTEVSKTAEESAE